MKSDRPKSVAFRCEFSLGDLKRKFYNKEMRSNKNVHEKSLYFSLAKTNISIPLVSCHGVLNHASDTQLQL